MTAIQRNLLNDTSHRFIVNPAGRRSRKTLIAKRKILYAALRNPGHRYFHGAPTRDQAKDIFWEDVKQQYRLFLAESPSESKLKIRLLNGSEIYIVGLDKPQRIEGQPWNGCHITEFADLKPGAWQNNIRPVLSDTRGFAILDGVPEGRNFYYDLALYAAGGALPETKPIKGAYADNDDWAYYAWFSADVLEPDEIDAAKRELDPRTFRQEFEASFEDIEGLAYYQFSDKNLKAVEYRQNEKVHVGMDFNVNPMTAVLCHTDGVTLEQFGEIYLKNSNTFEMRDALKERFKPEQIIIYPDSTGRATESNATESDLSILKQAGFEIRAHRSNPRIKDRVNAVNSLICSAKGAIRYFVNAQNCHHTLNDFHRVERLPDGRLNKKQEAEGLKHITDALGYLVAYKWPVKQRKTYEIYR